jgi:hypothetical protein
MYGEEYEKKFWKSLCQITLLVGVYKTCLKAMSHKW